MNGGRSESFPGNIPMISRLSQTGPTGPVTRVAPLAGGGVSRKNSVKFSLHGAGWFVTSLPPLCVQVVEDQIFQ